MAEIRGRRYPAATALQAVTPAVTPAGLPAVLSLLIQVLASLLSILPAPAPAQQQAPAPRAEQAGEQRAPILDDATLRREYDEYRASVAGMRLYRVSYIRVPTEAQARDLIARIRSGADFATLARRHSTHTESAGNGGALGDHASCKWAKATLQILDSLERGQTWSRPVKGTHGWGIYRLDAVMPIEPRAFASYKRELLAGKFEPECPWVPPVPIAPAPAAVAPGVGRR